MKCYRMLICVLCTMAMMLSACHKNKDDKASQHRDDLILSDKAVSVSDDKPFDFKKVDTSSYYVGEIEDVSYIYKVDHISKNGLKGRYYLVSKSQWLKAVRFEIEYKDGEYLFCTADKDVPFKFEATIDTAMWVAKISTSLVGDKKDCAFEKLRAPKFVLHDEELYARTGGGKPLSYEVKKDVQYGHTRWFWSTLEVKGEKYGKMITQGIAKSVAEKDIPLKMDIYLPELQAERRPLVVFVHGGAFYFGDKGAETMTTWCKNFAQKGYVTASVNYRLGFRLSKTSIQQCGYGAIQDLHAALRFLIENAGEYGIDTNKIFLAGTSAGSITALGVTFMTNSTRPDFVFSSKLDKKMGNIESASNSLKHRVHIAAVANMWGALYDLDELNGHNVPVISFHGTEDNLVPFDHGYPFSEVKGKLGEKMFDEMYGSKSIKHRLDSLHVRNEFYPLEGVGHAPYQDKKGHPNEYYYFIQDKMMDFFYKEVAKVGKISHDGQNKLYYNLHQDVKDVSWKADGGFIMDVKNNSVKVLWRRDSKTHRLTASGVLKNGASFTVNYDEK